jgi:hypothetical protein
MQTPTSQLSQQWPEPQRFPQFPDKMGRMMSEDYDSILGVFSRAGDMEQEITHLFFFTVI